MATMIRPNLSDKHKYWIPKHRHYELKHFCLQYPEWKKLYLEYGNTGISLSQIDRMPTSNLPSDPTAARAILKAQLAERMELIEKTAKQADRYLYEYLIKAVTEGRSYAQLKARYEIPCGRDMFYDRYRKFFWLLSESRN